jgi:thymidylate synthase (FAD)
MSRVRLISNSQPAIDLEDSEDIIAFTARVSNPSNQMNTETAPRLLRYLAKHQHWSPFEMAHVVMEIETTRDIARQILRHRSFAFQEFSQRYADPTTDLGFELRKARLQDLKNRQNSIEVENQELQNMWGIHQKAVTNAARMAYEWAIENGIAKEQARAVLPEGNTISRLYMAGSVRSWIHYCKLRMGPETQKEHREVAEACWIILLNEYPSLSEL